VRGIRGEKVFLMQGHHSPSHSKAKSNLRDVAYARLVSHLHTGTLRAGQFVSQRELMELAGTPLAAIREAIPRLEAERLLETVPQRGMQIARMDMRTVQDVFQLWMILARPVADTFARMAPDTLIDELCLQHNAALACTGQERDGAERARELELRFHEALTATARNDLIADAYRVNLVRVSIIALSRFAAPDSHAIGASLKERLKIITASKSRNSEQAAAAIEAHITANLQRTIVLASDVFMDAISASGLGGIIAA
jgi:DNA-binding GntR family transcriptional regulator